MGTPSDVALARRLDSCASVALSFAGQPPSRTGEEAQPFWFDPAVVQPRCVTFFNLDFLSWFARPSCSYQLDTFFDMFWRCEIGWAFSCAPLSVFWNHLCH